MLGVDRRRDGDKWGARASSYWRCTPLGGIELTAGSYAGSAFVSHVHDGLAVTAVVSGELCVQVGQAALRVRSGDMAVIAPKVFHRVCDGSGRGWSERVVYVTEEQLRRLGLVFPERLDQTVGIIRQRKLAYKFSALHEALELDPHQLEACRALHDNLGDILARAVKPELALCTKPPGTGAPQSFLQTIQETIARRFTEPLRLSELGSMVGHNAEYLQKCFKDAYGVSPYELITFMRVQHAKKRLAMGQPIAVAALDSGFCDQSHLHRRFYQVYGLTPGQYRFALNPDERDIVSRSSKTLRVECPTTCRNDSLVSYSV